MLMDLAPTFPLLIAAAAAYDAAIGERPLRIHPVMALGSALSFLEARLNKDPSSRGAALRGAALVLALLGVAWAYALAVGAGYRLAGTGTAATIMLGAITAYLLKTSFSIRAMGREAGAVRTLVEQGDLGNARRRVSYIVSRPTEDLSEEEVLSATVECVGESVVDGVIAPLFYAVLGGLYGCLGYRAANTADSRIGYRTERYRRFGMPAARLDDVLNYLPARLAVAETLLAAVVLRMDVRRGISVWRRDRSATQSPNAGHTMALYAGLLGVRLAKPGCYALGDAAERLSPAHVRRAWRLYTLTATLHVVASCVVAAALALPPGMVWP